MPSPTLTDISKKFSMIKQTFGLEKSNVIKIMNAFFLFYPIIVLLFLVIYKPKFIRSEDDDKLSFSKTVLWFIILQLPLVSYVLLTR
jgi:hypothetical protein